MRLKLSLSGYHPDYDRGENHIADVINRSPAATFVYSHRLANILSSKLLTNRHDTGVTDSGENELEFQMRVDLETSHLFGARTVYGMLINKARLLNEFQLGNSGYGDVAFIWSDNAKAKSTATLGDSLKIKQHRLQGTPVLTLSKGVSSGAVKHWLAQYGIYPDSDVNDVSNDRGHHRRKVNLAAFDVDKPSLKQAIGAYKDYVEVHHPGPLHFPFDFQAIVLANADYAAQVRKWCADQGYRRLRVLHVSDYHDQHRI
jgi:hypothetical protein